MKEIIIEVTEKGFETIYLKDGEEEPLTMAEKVHLLRSATHFYQNLYNIEMNVDEINKRVDK